MSSLLILIVSANASIFGSAPQVVGSIPNTKIHIDGKEYGKCLIARKIWEKDGYVVPYVPVMNPEPVTSTVPDISETAVPTIRIQEVEQNPTRPEEPQQQNPPPAPQNPPPVIEQPRPPAPQPNPPPPPPTRPNPSPASGLIGNCLNAFNTARFHENRAPALSWSASLASLASRSATFCANVRQQHTAQPANGGQILFITKTDCSSSMQGWFENERSWNGGHYQIIKNPRYRNVGCYVATTGSRCISCNFSP